MTDEKKLLIEEIVNKYKHCPYPAPRVTRRGKPHTTVDFSGISRDDVRARDEFYMSCAAELAALAADFGEVPVGAVMVMGDRVLAADFNGRETEKNALYHAELAVIGESCRVLGGWRLPGCELFVTLEPCIMCAGGIISARVPRVVFGASDKKAGAMGGVFDSTQLPLNHRAAVTSGVLAERCEALLTEFFEKKRNAVNNEININGKE